MFTQLGKGMGSLNRWTSFNRMSLSQQHSKDINIKKAFDGSLILVWRGPTRKQTLPILIEYIKRYIVSKMEVYQFNSRKRVSLIRLVKGLSHQNNGTLQ